MRPAKWAAGPVEVFTPPFANLSVAFTWDLADAIDRARWLALEEGRPYSLRRKALYDGGTRIGMLWAARKKL